MTLLYGKTADVSFVRIQQYTLVYHKRSFRLNIASLAHTLYMLVLFAGRM